MAKLPIEYAMLNIPLRGSVQSLTQHHEWLLVAARHSEGQNLGLQAIPLRNFNNRLHSFVWQIPTPKPIASLLSLPNPVRPALTLGVGDVQIEASVIEQFLISYHDICIAVTNEEDQEKKIKHLRTFVGAHANALMPYVNNEDAIYTLREELQKQQDIYRLSTSALLGQRVVAFDDDGQGYDIPNLPSEKDHVQTEVQVRPWDWNAKMEHVQAYSSHELLLVIRNKNNEQRVVLFDLDSKSISFVSISSLREYFSL